MPPSFPIGTLVFAKMRGFPYWPGIIAEATEELMRVPAKQGNHCIYFFGSRNYQWIEADKLKPYAENKEKFSKATKTAAFRKACADIEDFISKGHSVESLTATEEPSDSLLPSTSTSKETPSSSNKASKAKQLYESIKKSRETRYLSPNESDSDSSSSETSLSENSTPKVKRTVKPGKSRKEEHSSSESPKPGFSPTKTAKHGQSSSVLPKPGSSSKMSKDDQSLSKSSKPGFSPTKISRPGHGESPRRSISSKKSLKRDRSPRVLPKPSSSLKVSPKGVHSSSESSPPSSLLRKLPDFSSSESPKGDHSSSESPKSNFSSDRSQMQVDTFSESPDASSQSKLSDHAHSSSESSKHSLSVSPKAGPSLNESSKPVEDQEFSNNESSRASICDSLTSESSQVSNYDYLASESSQDSSYSSSDSSILFTGAPTFPREKKRTVMDEEVDFQEQLKETDDDIESKDLSKIKDNFDLILEETSEDTESKEPVGVKNEENSPSVSEEEDDESNENTSGESSSSEEEEVDSDQYKTQYELSSTGRGSSQYEAENFYYYGTPNPRKKFKFTDANLQPSMSTEEPSDYGKPSDSHWTESPPKKVEEIPLNSKYEKEILPSPKEFGFIGLGNMGSGIVRNILKYGHKLTIWNRTHEKCFDFIEAGARIAVSPGEVISNADITFCCVSDNAAALDVVFGDSGVLANIHVGKSYVEMSDIDSETSQKIADSVSAAGARYLEGRLQGSKNEAEKGTIFLMTAGERSLYDDCSSCFAAFCTKKAFFGGVGNAAEKQLILQSIRAAILLGLSETLAAGSELYDIPKSEALDFFEDAGIVSSQIADTCRNALKGNVSPQMAIKHLQKDVHMTLQIAEKVNTKVVLTSVVNERLKHFKRTGFENLDVGALALQNGRGSIDPPPARKPKSIE